VISSIARIAIVALGVLVVFLEALVHGHSILV
jgi:hypothetical protein